MKTVNSIGTSYFVSRGAAYKYYDKQGISKAEVNSKIEEGLITVKGIPKITPEQRLTVSEGRYHILEEAE